MSNVVKIIITLVIGVTIALLIAYFSMTGFAEDNKVFNVNSSLRSAVITTRDDSQRVMAHSYGLDVEEFEQFFIQDFSNNHSNVEGLNFEFEYLMSEEGKKAVRVLVINNTDVVYSTVVLGLGGE